MLQGIRIQSTVLKAMSLAHRRLFALQLFVIASLVLAAAPIRAEPVTLLALGDSLTAGYGLGPGEGFPAQLEEALLARGHDVRIIDAGVSATHPPAALPVWSGRSIR
jgi:lysophospholipase L1-like esterase